MCHNCVNSTKAKDGYNISYSCNICKTVTEIVDTYTQKRKILTDCPENKFQKLKQTTY